MLRITESESTKAAENYFKKSLDHGEYYLDEQEVPGSWGGLGAKLLGLAGKVNKDDFCKLINNYRPDGSRLTPRMLKNRRPGYDFTFDVPKSVSLAHAIGGDSRIEAAMKSALDETMLEIEQQMHTRVRRNGMNEDRRTGNMVWADFMHFTSRPTHLDSEVAESMGSVAKMLRNSNGEYLIADPHLHVHVYAMNATFDEQENQWKAGVFMQAKRDGAYYQAAYHSRLAGELQKLGYEIEETHNAFEIKGIDRNTIEGFSRRTQEVETMAKELGIEDEKAKAELGLKSRHAKQPELKLSQLKKCWEKMAGKHNSDQLKLVVNEAIEMTRGIVRNATRKAREAIGYALQKELERVSEVAQARLLATALEKSVGKATVSEVKKAFEERTDILKAEIAGQSRISTREILKEESELLQFIRDNKGQRVPLHRGDYEFKNPLFLKDSAVEQRLAIEKFLNSKDWVFGLIGRAGTGKTTLLKEVESAVGKVGAKLITVAPTAEASRGVLRKEGFKDAETVKRLLVDPKMQRNLRGNILWVDEAGMIGNRDMLKLLTLAKANGAKRVVLSGDPTQIRSVPRGDTLQFLEARAGLSIARLQKIQRQKTPKLKKVVEDISKQKISQGFQKLEEMKCIHEVENEKLPESLAQAYVDRISEKEKSILVVCPTHKEGGLITDKIREKLKESGQLGIADHNVIKTVNLGLTDSEKSRAVTYYKGMVIEFRKNSKGFRKSERARVIEIDPEKQKVQVINNFGILSELPLNRPDRFDVFALGKITISAGDKLRITQNSIIEGHRYNNGDTVKVQNVDINGDIVLEGGKILPSYFGHINHGYVHTADASQAKTVDSVLIGVGVNSMGATDMRRMYVAISRARYEAKVFTDNKEELEVAASRDSVRRTAHEIHEMEQAQKVIKLVQRQHRLRQRKHLRIETVVPSKTPSNPTPKLTRNLSRFLVNKTPEIEMEI